MSFYKQLLLKFQISIHVMAVKIWKQYFYLFVAILLVILILSSHCILWKFLYHKLHLLEFKDLTENKYNLSCGTDIGLVQLLDILHQKQTFSSTMVKYTSFFKRF